MMCALLLKPLHAERRGWLRRASERVFDGMLRAYRTTLAATLRHPGSVMLILLLTLCLNVYLFVAIPKGFFPQQDTGRINGSIQGDQSISFQLMRQKLAQFLEIMKKDPAVDTAVGFTGGGQTNSGFTFASLKPLSERNISADQVIGRLRRELAQVPGANLFLQAVQDVRVGGRQANAQYQYTLQADNLADLYAWGPRILAALQRLPISTAISRTRDSRPNW